ncbi:MAG: hypothetical protein AAFY26_21070 [Cyanobacteria bacterium J06638_22]
MPVLVGGKKPKKPKIKGEWLAIGLGLPALLIVGAIAYVRDTNLEAQDTVPTPVAAPAPVESPVSAASPVPVASPTPEVSPPAPEVHQGIGVSRAAIQSVFEDPEVGFVFEEPALAQGQPRIMGTAPNQIALIELIGPPDNLTSAGILIGVPIDNNEAIAQNAAYTLGFLQVAVPGWTDGGDWLVRNLDAIHQGRARQASTVFGDKRIELVSLTEIGMVSLSVEPAQN